MARQPLTPSQKSFQLRSMLIGLVTALIVMAGAFFVVKPLMPDGPRRFDDILAVAAAFIMLPMALMSGFVHSVFPKDAPMQQRRLSQVLCAAISAAVLLLPIIGGRFIDPVLNFAINLVLMAVCYVVIWLIWRAADELQRSLMKDSYVAGYHVVFAVLFVYAIGERLGLLGGATAWGALAFATLAQYACSVWVVIRRGAHQPPTD